MKLIHIPIHLFQQNIFPLIEFLLHSCESDDDESSIPFANLTINKIEAYVDNCGSDSQIALIGYSQGGNVMTDVLAGGVDKPAPLSDQYRQNSKSIQ